MDAHKETLGLYNRYKGRICAEKGEGVSIVERRKGGSVQVHF